jgi:hypothetical protein
MTVPVNMFENAESTAVQQIIVLTLRTLFVAWFMCESAGHSHSADWCATAGFAS